jgi:hypothetical protein
MNIVFFKVTLVVKFIKPDSPEEFDIAVHFLNSLLNDVRRDRKRNYGIASYIFGHNAALFIAGGIAG